MKKKIMKNVKIEKINIVPSIDEWMHWLTDWLAVPLHCLFTFVPNELWWLNAIDSQILCREGALAHCWPQFKQIKLPILFYGGYRTEQRKNWAIPEQKKPIPGGLVKHSLRSVFSRRSPDQPITFKSLEKYIGGFSVGLFWNIHQKKQNRTDSQNARRNQAIPVNIHSTIVLWILKFSA